MVLGSVRAALFGIVTWRMVKQHLALVGLMMFILLMVAWTIDLASEFNRVKRTAIENDRAVAGVVYRYLLYRGADIVAHLLPMAVFFGVFLSEILRRMRSETVILDAAGVTPLRLLVGVLWLGAILGGLQGMLEARWRPAAIKAQVEESLGHYGRHFREGWTGRAHWFFSGNVMLRAEVFRAPAPEMRNVVVFQGTDQHRLTAIYRAERMVPGAQDFTWRMSDVALWPEGNKAVETRETLDLTLLLLPLSLRYIGVDKYFLSTEELRAFRVLPPQDRPAEVQMATWRRRISWLIPAVYAVMAIVLARAGFDGRQAVIPKLIGLAATGYIAVVSLKVCWSVGELGVMPAFLASTGGMLFSGALALVVSQRLLFKRLRARHKSRRAIGPAADVNAP